MRLRVRVLRVVRNESKAPGGSNKGVRVWARSKHILKGPTTARAAVPPDDRSRAARRYTSKITLELFFWCGARRALGSCQAAGCWNPPRGQFFCCARWEGSDRQAVKLQWCKFRVFGYRLGLF